MGITGVKPAVPKAPPKAAPAQVDFDALTGKLTINATRNADEVVVQLSKDKKRVLVNVNGKERSFDAKSVKGVEVNAKGGDDKVGIGKGVPNAVVNAGKGGSIEVINQANNARINVASADSSFVNNNADQARIRGGHGDDQFISQGRGNTLIGGDGNNLVSSRGDNGKIVTGKGQDDVRVLGNKNAIQDKGSGAGDVGSRDSIALGGNSNTVDLRGNRNFDVSLLPGKDGRADTGSNSNNTFKVTTPELKTISTDGTSSTRGVTKPTVQQLGFGNKTVAYPEKQPAPAKKR